LALETRLDLPIHAERSVGRAPGLRLDHRILVPAADALAVLSAGTFIGRWDTYVVVYGALVLLLTNLSIVRGNRIDPRLGEDLGWLLGRIATPLLLVLPLVPHDVKLDRLVALAALTALFVAGGRAVTYSLLRAAKRRGLIGEATLIIGSGAVGAELASILQQHPEYGLRPVGFLDRFPADGLPLPLLGGPEDLAPVVAETYVRRVIVAFGDAGEDSLVPLLRTSQRLGVRMHVVPRFFELGGPPEGAVADYLWGIPVIPLAYPAFGPTARIVKRTFDLVFGSLLLVLTAPLLAAGAIAVRLSSPGPILFRQPRIGRWAREFEIFKFRTMYVNDESDTKWFVTEDDRITKVGRVLRRLSLDELPQLFNVVKGDMALVGPRPERPHYVSQFSETVNGYRDRHRLDVGITGWAQIHGRSRDIEAIPERARFDNYYIERWSLWRDLVIIARTIRLLIREH
jgi:exopolysaccharide biosynthesis polyprenyl glycosylphosphotransferase